MKIFLFYNILLYNFIPMPIEKILLFLKKNFHWRSRFAPFFDTYIQRETFKIIILIIKNDLS